ncbi:reverse transcriptase domain-containing protein [Tanacetum coccineum]
MGIQFSISGSNVDKPEFSFEVCPILTRRSHIPLRSHEQCIPIEVEPLDETPPEDLGLNTCNHDIPLSSKEIPSIDEPEPQPQPLPNCLSLDVSLGEEKGPKPPIKPHSPDSFRIKEVDSLTINTPPSPHVASSHPKDTYCYYRPCIDDPKKHYGFKLGLLGKSASLGEELSLFDRPNEVERSRILEAHRLESILQQQISQLMAPSHQYGRKAHLLEDKQIPSVGVFDEDNQFDGRIRSDPHRHVADFLEISNLFRYGKNQEEAVMLRNFPFSLSGEAKIWLNELNEGTITSWNVLREAFISRYFSPAKFKRLLNEIHNFQQLGYETLVEAWLRMKEMLRTCYGHGLTKGMIIHTFYHGLDDPTQGILNAGGIFLYNTLNEAFKILKDKVLLKLDFSDDSQENPKPNTVVSAGGSNNDFDHAILVEKFEALATKIGSKFSIIRKKLKEMRDGRRDNQASQVYMKYETPMCEPFEANYVQGYHEGYHDQNSKILNRQASIKNLKRKFEYLKKIQPSKSLPRTTYTKPRHEFVYKPPLIRNENDKGDVEFIKEDETQPIPTIPNSSLINSNSPTVSPYLKDCTVHIPYTNANTFADDVLPNHVGDKEFK